MKSTIKIMLVMVIILSLVAPPFLYAGTSCGKSKKSDKSSTSSQNTVITKYEATVYKV